jgi:hypothetical protein
MEQAWLLNQAAFRLRDMGRLHEASQPMRARLERLGESAAVKADLDEAQTIAERGEMRPWPPQ